MVSLSKFILFIITVTCSIHCTPVTVYVCGSKNAMKYHYRENCRGLSNCHYRILKTTLDEAQKSHKQLCSWERNDKPGAK